MGEVDDSLISRIFVTLNIPDRSRRRGGSAARRGIGIRIHNASLLKDSLSLLKDSLRGRICFHRISDLDIS